MIFVIISVYKYNRFFLSFWTKLGYNFEFGLWICGVFLPVSWSDLVIWRWTVGFTKVGYTCWNLSTWSLIDLVNITSLNLLIGIEWWFTTHSHSSGLEVQFIGCSIYGENLMEIFDDHMVDEFYDQWRFGVHVRWIRWLDAVGWS